MDPENLMLLSQEIKRSSAGLLCSHNPLTACRRKSTATGIDENKGEVGAASRGRLAGHSVKPISVKPSDSRICSRRVLHAMNQ